MTTTYLVPDSATYDAIAEEYRAAAQYAWEIGKPGTAGLLDEIADALEQVSIACDQVGDDNLPVITAFRR